MKTAFLFSTLLSLTAFAGECPNLTGTYLMPPTPYSTLENGYKITQADQNGVMVYQVNEISVESSSGQVIPGMQYQYVADGIRHSSPNEVIPGAATKTYCSDGELVYEEIGFLVITSSRKFSLDENGNLVLDERVSQTFPRVK